jgi:hypothetical protein
MLEYLTVFDGVRLVLTVSDRSEDDLLRLVEPLFVSTKDQTLSTYLDIEHLISSCNLFNHMIETAVLELISLQNLICYECVSAFSGNQDTAGDSDEDNLDRFIFNVRKMFKLSSVRMECQKMTEYQLYLRDKPDLCFAFALSDNVSAIRTNNWQKVAVNVSMYLLSQKNTYLKHYRKFSLDKFDMSFKFLTSQLEACPFTLAPKHGNLVYSKGTTIFLNTLFEIVIDSIVHTYREFSVVRPIGFLAQTPVEFDEHCFGLEHHRCVMNFGKLHQGYHHAQLIVYQVDLKIIDKRFVSALKLFIRMQIYFCEYTKRNLLVKFNNENNEIDVCVMEDDRPRTLFKVSLIFIANRDVLPIYAVPLFVSNDTRFTMRNDTFAMATVRWKFYEGCRDLHNDDEHWSKFAIFYHDEESVNASDFLQFLRAFLKHTRKLKKNIAYNYFHVQNVKKADIFAPISPPSLLSHCVILRRFTRIPPPEEVQCYSVSAKYTLDSESDLRCFVMHVECTL